MSKPTITLFGIKSVVRISCEGRDTFLPRDNILGVEDCKVWGENPTNLISGFRVLLAGTHYLDFKGMTAAEAAASIF